MEYGNMFFNYRIASVWSSPEILANLKKLPKLTPQMDIYSYGMIIWEIWHQSVPFDGDIAAAQDYVVKEESRPKIIQSSADLDQEEMYQSEALAKSPEGKVVSIINGNISDSSKEEIKDQTYCD
jgi:hypothetical protein